MLHSTPALLIWCCFIAYAVLFDVADSTLENIVQFPSMSVSELSVFQACPAWSSKECHRQGIDVTPENQRSVLGSVLFHIRFPTMSLVEFAQEVSKTNVLTADDRCAVFEYVEETLVAAVKTVMQKEPLLQTPKLQSSIAISRRACVSRRRRAKIPRRSSSLDSRPSRSAAYIPATAA